MAVTISGTPTTKQLALDFRDFFNQPFVRRTDISGAIIDADAIALVTALDGCTNAKIDKAGLTARYTFAGMKGSAVAALHELASIVVVLTFHATKADGKQATRSFLIPAPLANLVTDGAAIDIVTNTSMAALIPLLEDNLQWIDSDDTVQTGGMLYDPTSSRLATLADVVEVP